MLDFTFMVEFMENGNNNDLLLKTKYTLDRVVPCTQRTYEGIMATLVFFSYEKPTKYLLLMVPLIREKQTNLSFEISWPKAAADVVRSQYKNLTRV